MDFLPVCKEDMQKRGWDELDFVLVTGDAYIDHPSFGAAIIARLLESHGFKVGIIPQPNWRDKESFNVFGKPRLSFLVTGGNIDSMVNHYSVAKKRRKKRLILSSWSYGTSSGQSNYCLLSENKRVIQRRTYYDWWA